MLGRAWTRLRRFDTADRHYRRPLDLCGRLGDDVGRAHTHLNLAWLSELIAHNEDGSAWQDSRCSLLTLLIDGDPPVTAWCCPCTSPTASGSRTATARTGPGSWSLLTPQW